MEGRHGGMRERVENRIPLQTSEMNYPYVPATAGKPVRPAHTSPRPNEAMRAVAIASSRRMFSKGHRLTRTGELDEDARDIYEQNVAVGSRGPMFLSPFRASAMHVVKLWPVGIKQPGPKARDEARHLRVTLASTENYGATI
jgi:hypothetical protein